MANEALEGLQQVGYDHKPCPGRGIVRPGRVDHSRPNPVCGWHFGPAKGRLSPNFFRELKIALASGLYGRLRDLTRKDIMIKTVFVCLTLLVGTMGSAPAREAKLVRYPDYHAGKVPLPISVISGQPTKTEKISNA